MKCTRLWLGLLAFFPSSAWAGPTIIPVTPRDPTLGWSGFGQSGSVPWSIVVLLTVLTLLPAMLLCMTPFVRLLVVFHFLRQALGTQTAPTNQTLLGLALVLTFFLMQPVGVAIQKVAIVPFQQGQIDAMQAVEAGSVPLKSFMLRFIRPKDEALFVELGHIQRTARDRRFALPRRHAGLHPL